MFTLDPDSLTRILFPMTDWAKAVTGVIDCDALVDALGQPGADPLLVFENNRPNIEELPRAKYDVEGFGVDSVELTEEDLEER
jgi:hypothetical protein